MFPVTSDNDVGMLRITVVRALAVLERFIPDRSCRLVETRSIGKRLQHFNFRLLPSFSLQATAADSQAHS